MIAIETSKINIITNKLKVDLNNLYICEKKDGFLFSLNPVF